MIHTPTETPMLTHLQTVIHDHGGWIPFSTYMNTALYAPNLGYYVAGLPVLGRQGDFITAPLLTPLFGHALAQAILPMLTPDMPNILEFGAGNGVLAADMLNYLDAQQHLPEHYFIVELSPSLRAQQQATVQQQVPHLYARVVWLDTLPTQYDGVIVANEVLDAMPVELIHWQQGTLWQRGVIWDTEKQSFAWENKTCPPALIEQVHQLEHDDWPEDYLTEICPTATAWINTLAHILRRGVMMLIDYGFPQREYYHPQRSEGTLMCHYQHRAHPDPFFRPGEQDITTHVDFTHIALTADKANLCLGTYTTQAQFLLNAGILDQLSALSTRSETERLKHTAAIQTLLSPAEMGELFKVMILTTHDKSMLAHDLSLRDHCHRL